MSERNLKETILRLLQTHHLLSVGDILLKLKAKGKKYNKTSVYRALDQLLKDNQVCRHYFQEAEALYELHEDDHTHLVCNNCGNISIGECSYVQPNLENGFQIDHHHVTLTGLCADCAHIKN